MNQQADIAPEPGTKAAQLRRHKKKTVQHKGWHEEFLRILARTGNVTVAAEAASVSRDVAYDHRTKFPQFLKQWERAIEQSNDRLEAEALRRATRGVEEPLWMKDENGKPVMVDRVKKYSDTLLIFLLKANRPEKFRERYTTEITGAEGKPIAIEHRSINANITFDWEGFAELCRSVSLGANGNGSHEPVHPARPAPEAGPVPRFAVP